jgi:hypothetical protein
MRHDIKFKQRICFDHYINTTVQQQYTFLLSIDNTFPFQDCNPSIKKAQHPPPVD